MSTLEQRREYVTTDAHTDGVTVAYQGHMAITLTCGCGFTVIVVCASRTAHHDGHDRAERALSDHHDREETAACRPWLR